MTVPLAGASTGISIFMDSMITTGVPAVIRVPGGATTFHTTPVTGVSNSTRATGRVQQAAGVDATIGDLGFQPLITTSDPSVTST